MQVNQEQQATAGLFANGQRVPLTGVAIEINASGVASKVTVAQRYRNEEKVTVEAVYSFPIEESAAVCGFEAQIDGRRIIGHVEEKEKAFEKYDDALADGHGAFLLDQDRPNIFTASVGNLLPGQEVVIRLTYVNELEQRGDSIRLMLPTTISPRYIPQQQLATIDPAELDHITPPILARVPYGLTLCAQIETTAAIESVECPSHPARVSLGDRSARVELMGSSIQLDRDFVVSVKLKERHQASALVAHGDQGERVVMLNLFPDLSGLRRPQSEILFLLDRSGSMMGESIEQARNALLLCLRSLEEGDHFNIIGFGSSHETLFRESVPYNQTNLDKATAHVQRVDADLGGTELLAPLTDILQRKSVEGRLRQLILLTDGQVSNEAQCIELAALHVESSRIFTFGIGHGASEYLVRGLARATRGEAELIHPNERIEAKVTRQFNRLSSAGLKELSIDWGPLQKDLVAPAEVPPLFDGDRLTVYARLTSAAAGEVAIKAKGPDGEVRFAVQVDPERALPDSGIPVLMARRAIQDLEEGRGAQRGSSQANRRKKGAEKRIIELGCRYGLMSSYTSFVAIEERPADQQTTRPAELRRIPVALTKGWHGLEQQPVPMSPSMTMAGAIAPSRSAGFAGGAPRFGAPKAAAPPAPMRPKAKARKKTGGLLKRATEAIGGLFEGRAEKEVYADAEAMEEFEDAMYDKAAAPEEAAGFGATDALMSLCLAQTAAGYWELNAGLASQSGQSLEALGAAAAELGLDTELSHRIVGTLIALHLLENLYADRGDQWSGLSRKAKRWIDKQNASIPAGFSDLPTWLTSKL